MTDNDTTECTHPEDAVMWNPWNKVVQCHCCGALDSTEHETCGEPHKRTPEQIEAGIRKAREVLAQGDEALGRYLTEGE